MSNTEPQRKELQRPQRKELQRQEHVLSNLYSISEFRGIEMCRSHHHSKHQLLKVSSELRLQVTDQILNHKKNKHEGRQLTRGSVSTSQFKLLTYHRAYLPIGSFIRCNHRNPLLVATTSQ